MRQDKRYQFKTKFENSDEIIAWCKEHFGPKHRKRWGFSKGIKYDLDASWHTYPPIIYIVNIEDSFAFKLRWL